jgi:uncharacterized protein (TIGR00295 family)
MGAEEECEDMLRNVGCPEIVVKHCKAVKSVAMKIAEIAARNGNNVNQDLIIRGAMLHDIGRCRTNGIEHAVVGARLARELGVDERVVRIIERHIGGGLDEEDAKALGLPEGNYMPETIEEKIVCHADNLIATTRRQTVEDEIEALRKKGLTNAAEKVMNLHKELSELCGIDLDEL